jgi:DNA-binding transcriptional regulator YiaG
MTTGPFLVFRRRFRLSQAAAAAMIGVSESTWGNYENGIHQAPGPARVLVTLLLHQPALLNLLRPPATTTQAEPDA